MPTIDELIRRRQADQRPGLLFADRTWTHAEVVAAQAQRAAVLSSMRQPGPFHVALLLDNVPEYVFWMGAAALAGAVLVGGNPTHRGDELARDLAHTECQLLVTSAEYRRLVDGQDLGPALGPARILVIDDPFGDTRSDPVTPYGDPARSDGGQRRSLTRPPPPSPRRPSASCCSPRGHRALPRRASAVRGAWPASDRSWPRCSS